jgi:hypothetical protein
MATRSGQFVKIFADERIAAWAAIAKPFFPALLSRSLKRLRLVTEARRGEGALGQSGQNLTLTLAAADSVLGTSERGLFEGLHSPDGIYIVEEDPFEEVSESIAARPSARW